MHEARLLAQEIEHLFGALKDVGEKWNAVNDKADALGDEYLDALREKAAWRPEHVNEASPHLEPPWLLYKPNRKPV